MDIRPARVSDAAGISDLVNDYAEQGLMLHRSMESIYEALREFQVAVEDGKVIGCVAVDLYWSDLAEVKSLAVAPQARGQGLGNRLMEVAIADARRLGVRRLFALTYQEKFFLRNGFERIDRSCLPEKVWRECLGCPKNDACDEIAVLRVLDMPTGATQEAAAGGSARR